LNSGKFDVANALKLDPLLQMDEKAMATHVIPFLKLASME
jgi:hypothetical protein